MDPYKFKYCPFCGRALQTRSIEGKARNYCPDCGYVHYVNPLPIVAIVIEEKGKILIVKRAIEPQKGKWVLPGGFVDDDETPERAALRELKEETDLQGHKPDFITMVSNKSELYGPILMMGFYVSDWKGIPKAGDDALEVRFEKINDPARIAFHTHRIILKEFWRDKKKN
ncbi:MAG: NUDIX hydrolase [Spirochaetes bacterium]|nr:NUDIX hydrolase [Spirochaetota bacterium]